MNAKKAPQKKIFSKKLTKSEKMCRGTAIKNQCRGTKITTVPCRASAVKKSEGIFIPDLTCVNYD